MTASIEIFGRQTLEELYDLLMEQPDRHLHDMSCEDLAAEIAKRCGFPHLIGLGRASLVGRRNPETGALEWSDGVQRKRPHDPL